MDEGRTELGRSAIMTYRHRQTSWFAPIAMLVIGAVGGVLLAAAGIWVGAVALVLILVPVAVVMSRLTVEVDARSVTVVMGWRWPVRRIALDDIVSVAPVRVQWWQGWGIRKVRGGWMYDIAGRDAVALELRAGNVFWIGTDEPAALTAALESAIVRR